MTNLEFCELIKLIFHEAFQIRTYKNRERKGACSDLFSTYQLGRDLKLVEDGEPIVKPSLYHGAIIEFYQGPTDFCILRTSLLFERLVKEGYIICSDTGDIINKCEKNTLVMYKDLLTDIWNYYFTAYSRNELPNIQTYCVPQELSDKIILQYSKDRYGLNLNYFYEIREELKQQMETKSPDNISITRIIDTFKSLLRDKTYYALTEEEKALFIEALYTLSDILDKIHHEDAYSINLEILQFYNNLHKDDFTNIDINHVRKIQGCIYAIAIDPNESSCSGDMELTEHNNLSCKTYNPKTISKAEKYDICLAALTNLLKHNRLSKRHSSIEMNDYDSYETKIYRKRSFTEAEIQELYVLSLIYSNIAAIHLQYVKLGSRIDHMEKCIEYQRHSGGIRELLVRINKNMYGTDSTQHRESVNALLNFFNTVATRFYYKNNYSYATAIRAVLYSHFLSVQNKGKANMQLDLAPIAQLEQNNGGSDSFNTALQQFQTDYKKHLKHLSFNTIPSYDEFSSLVKQYQNYKAMFS